MIEFPSHIDSSITLAINDIASRAGSAVTGMSVFCSRKDTWIPLYILTAVFLVRQMGWKKALLTIAGVAVCIGLCDQTANLFKHGFERLRPCYNQHVLQEGLNIFEKRGSLFGFFSAHAAITFGTNTCAIFCLRKAIGRFHLPFSSAAIFWALAVSLSRVVVGKHFFGDITAGAIIGIFYGYLVALALSFLLRKAG